MHKTHIFGLAVAASFLASGCASTPPIHELRTHANESFAREEYKRTVAFDTEILRRNPNDVNATIQRGVAYDRLGASADAASDYSRAVELAPDQPLPRLYRANLALKANQIEVASADVKELRGMELEGHEAVAALCLEGTVAQRRGDMHGALRTYKQAVDAGRSNPDPLSQKHYRDALHNASEVQYRLGNFDQASALYAEHMQAKARADEPVTEDDHYAMGVLNYLKGDFAKARTHFAKVSPGRKKQAAKLLNDEGFFAGRG